MSWGAALAIGSTVLDMYSSDQAADAEQAQAKRRAEVARQNAKIVRAQGAEDARRFRLQSRQRLGTGRAAVGASGVQMTGSALDVLEQNALNMELDALTIEYESDIRAWNLESAGEDFDLRARNIGKQHQYQAAATLMTGAYNTYDAWPS